MATTVLATRNLPSYRVYCRSAPQYNLAVGEGVAILAKIDANDDRQHWYKDDTYSNVLDKLGYPLFSLVNKATGQTLKHSFSHPLPVKLVDYTPNVFDESILWSLANDRGENYRAIRSSQCESHLEAAPLNIDKFYLGAIIVGGPWIDTYDQQWKIEPFY
ncbi:ricin B-like lectin R40G3 [Tripterygium wilfordii]|uniref:ricin B-like lectin R40G3 n=1 Tax=Tripterygium wilfordii TaxID=458696 RepID=UPI0018F80508|nr:ricin B-like lectin R40G3 [Tripterygium wilfordii]